jgi:RimJ/RimL family protein N-acetyltransferase
MVPVTTYLLTRRIVIRRFTKADADWLADLHGDPAVMRYLDVSPVPRQVSTEQTLPGYLRGYRELDPGLGHFAAIGRRTGTPLGWFALEPASSTGLDGGSELGYRLVPAVWGQGLATEGAEAMVRHGFAWLGLDRIVATTMAVNLASRRVLEKAGLMLTRTFHADWPQHLDGAEHGDVVYELTRRQWLAGHQPSSASRSSPIPK